MTFNHSFSNYISMPCPAFADQLHYGGDLVSQLKSHPSHREEGSGHAAAIELSAWQKPTVTNEIRAILVDYIHFHGVAITSRV